MKIVKQDWTFEVAPKGRELLETIETAGRLCYQSEKKVCDDPWEETKRFVKDKIEKGHLSVIEHGAIIVKIITDRGVTHELVRHRLVSYSQESTRFCNYSKEKFGGEIKCIEPTFELTDTDKTLLRYIEAHYLDALKTKRLSPQEARYFLPNGLKTEIIVTANPREWRHILSLRISPRAHPQIRALMLDMLAEFKCQFPVLFDDIGEGAQ